MAGSVVRIVPASDPATLRQLASLLEHRNAQGRPGARLSSEQLGELGTMVMEGKVPTIGWWRRALGHD